MGDLGHVMTLGGDQLASADPRAWAFRVFLKRGKGKDAIYLSPFAGTSDDGNQYGVKRGEKVKLGDVPGDKNTRSFLQYSSDVLRAKNRANFEDTSYRNLVDKIFRAFFPKRKTGLLINPAYNGEDGGHVLYNFAPHYGFSIIGVPHGRYSIVNSGDMPGYTGNSDKHEKELTKHDVDDMLYHSFDAKDLHDAFKGHKVNPLYRAVMDHFKSSPAYKNMTEADKKMLFDGGTYDDLVKALAFSSGVNIFSREFGEDSLPAAVMARVMEPKIGGYIPASGDGSADFFMGNKDPGWQDYMHDMVVQALLNTIYAAYDPEYHGGDSRDDIVLTQVASPVSDLLKNDDIAEGRVAGQRDFSPELISSSFAIDHDIGSAGELLDKGGPLYNYYMLRLRGESGAEAWRKALGERFGDIRYLVSDEEKKDVCKMMADDARKYLEHSGICASLKRGPGND